MGRGEVLFNFQRPAKDVQGSCSLVCIYCAYLQFSDPIYLTLPDLYPQPFNVMRSHELVERVNNNI